MDEFQSTRGSEPACASNGSLALCKPVNCAPKRGKLVPPSAEPLDPVATEIIAAAQPRRSRKRRRPDSRGKRATVAEVQERIVGVAKLLIKRLHKYQIKQFIVEKFDLSPRAAENYISRARCYLIDQSKRPRDDFVAEAVGFYEDILRDPEAPRRDKFEAQRALRELLGLDMPFKVAPTNAEGESAPIPIQVVQSMSLEELAVLRSLHIRAQAAQNSLLPSDGSATNHSNKNGLPF